MVCMRGKCVWRMYSTDLLSFIIRITILVLDVL